MTRKIGTLLVLFLFVVGCTPLFAQQTEKQRQRSEDRQRAEETEDYFKKWLNEDVVWIIGEEEREMFQKLTTDEEREQFIEQFWRRRDPDPRTSENEFMVEHYRRIQYANETFHAGIPGWKTDRGRIYIMFGPPDRKESYPMGGWYERKGWEGGGRTHVFPFEFWEYNYIPGVGTDVELEFVDPGASNMYRLTMNPQEKDEFLHVPGSGLTFDEMFDPRFGGRKSFNRVVGLREGGDAMGMGISERTKDHPFQKAELMMKISKAAGSTFDDLKEVVETEIFYDALPFLVDTHLIHIGGSDYLVPVTVSFDQSEVSFKDSNNGRRSHLQLYGLVRTLTKRYVTEFDADIERRYTEAEFLDSLNQKGIYQHKLALKTGKYKLDLVFKDMISNKTGTVTLGIDVPAPKEELSTSSIILTRQIEATSLDLSEPFVVGRYKVRPELDPLFSKDDYLGFYFEVYDFAVDQGTGMPDVQIEYAIIGEGAPPKEFKTIDRATLSSDRLYVVRMVHLLPYEPQRYILYCRVNDRIGGRTITTRTPFEIRAADSAR